jgi:hypothetical protein
MRQHAIKSTAYASPTIALLWLAREEGVRDDSDGCSRLQGRLAERPRLRARQASTAPNPPRETPAYSRPGFVRERACLGAVTPQGCPECGGPLRSILAPAPFGLANDSQLPPQTCRRRPAPHPERGPVRRSGPPASLTPTRVSPTTTTEYEQHYEHDQYSLQGHSSSPPANAVQRVTTSSNLVAVIPPAYWTFVYATCTCRFAYGVVSPWDRATDSKTESR